MRRLLILLVLTSIVFAGCGSKDEASAKKEIDTVEAVEKTKNQEVIYVKTQTIEAMDFEDRLSLSADIKPKEEVMISSKISGSIENIFEDVGSRVEKGQKLCKIDDTIYKIQFQKADTAVKNAVNTLSSLKDFSENEGVKSQYETAKIDYENTKKTYDRMKGLYDEKAISESDFEKIKGQYDLALSNFNQAKRNWKYNVTAAEIALEAAKNDYELAKENLEYTDIVASISGIISEKNISMGKNVGPGDVLFTIVNTDNVYAESGVSEKDIAKIKVGQRVLVKIDALGGKVFEGKVETISPVINEQSKTYPIKVLIENIDNELKGGMFANMEIIVDTRKDVIGIPKDAVLNEGGKYYVFIEKDGKAEKRIVKLGYSKDDYYEVLEGVKIGEKVINSFNDKIEDGSLVKSN